jgi:hypothetical protein
MNMKQFIYLSVDETETNESQDANPAFSQGTVVHSYFVEFNYHK